MFPPCRLIGSEALVTLLLLAGPVCAQEVGNVQQGKVVYEKYCVLCHGEQGDGKGHFSEATTPVPRDFRQGTFKWRTTPSGSLPTDADLERVLMTGLYGTSMSSFSTTLSHAQRLDVIAYIKTFSPRFDREASADDYHSARTSLHTQIRRTRRGHIREIQLRAMPWRWR